jgi:hypothetical protein
LGVICLQDLKAVDRETGLYQAGFVKPGKPLSKIIGFWFDVHRKILTWS